MPVMPERSRSCPTFISFSAALQALGSVLLLCFVMAGTFSDITVPFIYVLLAAVGLLTAAGNSRLKKWARYSTSGFSALLILLPIGIISYYVHLNSLVDPNNAADADFMGYLLGIGFVLMLIVLPLSALGGFWLYFFNRRSIKQLFANVGKESTRGLCRALRLGAPHKPVLLVWVFS